MNSVAAVEAVPVAGPMFALLVGVVVVVLGIAQWRIHPFFALMLAAVSVGVVTALGGWSDMSTIGAIDLATSSLGKSAGGIAGIIAMDERRLRWPWPGSFWRSRFSLIRFFCCSCRWRECSRNEPVKTICSTYWRCARVV